MTKSLTFIPYSIFQLLITYDRWKRKVEYNKIDGKRKWNTK